MNCLRGLIEEGGLKLSTICSCLKDCMKMDWESSKYSLFILGATAFVCSRSLFIFFDDPEGPNLLVVAVGAAVLYVPSLIVYVWYAPVSVFIRISCALLVQVLLVAVLYFFM